MHSKDILERQNKILEIIISSYIVSAIPVGSQLVSKMMGLSSATIRNIMSGLEDLGYVTHPHTSAGRIPTDKGYRCYIDSLMHIKNINKEEAKRIEEEYKFKKKGIEDIIKKTAEVLATITHQTGIVLFPKFKRSVFKRIDLISLGRGRTLVVLVTSMGIVKDFIIDTKESTDKYLETIAHILNSDYCGVTLENIKEILIKRVREERDSLHNIVKETSDIVESILQFYYENELYLEGTSALLAQPEFEDANSAKSMLKIFEDKNMLSKFMEEDLAREGIRIYIGTENKDKNIQNCSILTAGYRLKDELIGRLGIIGPTRMEYDHLIPLVNYISETVTNVLNEFAE